MPIYEYACCSCGGTHELLQKINAQPPIQCPSCNEKGTLDKLMSCSSFHLKGGGWYKDLYASAKPKQQETQTKAETNKKNSTKNVKSEKAATKTDKAS